MPDENLIGQGTLGQGTLDQGTLDEGPFLISCLGVDLELALLPHFLSHYADLGVAPAAMRLILNSADAESPNLERAERVLAEQGAPPPRRWIAEYTSASMWEQRRAVQREEVPARAWVVNADVDELHEYPASLQAVTAYLEAKGYNAVQGVFVDRLTKDGTLAAVRPNPAIAEQFPVTGEVALSLGGQGEHHDVTGTVKLMLHRGDVLPSRGGHAAGAEGAPPRYATGGRLDGFARVVDPASRLRFPFRVHHYKWTGTLRDSLARRLAAPGVSAAGAEYGRKLADHVARHDGIDLSAVATGRVGGKAPWKLVLLRMRAAALARHLSQRARARLGR